MRWLRQSARRLALDTMSSAELLMGGEQRIGSQPILQIANFHHLYDYEVPKFRSFIEWFRSKYNVVPYSQATDLVASGKIDATYGAITFDDGLKSVLNAVKVLREFDLSAMFFICPQIIGETDPGKLREFHIQSRFNYESDEVINWDEVDYMLDHNQEIGSHTVSHPELSSLSADQIREELEQSRLQIEQKTGKPVEHFAWPFGTFASLGKVAAKIAIESDYKSVGTGVRGAHAPDESKSKIIPFLRRDNFEARWPLRHIKYFLMQNAKRPIRRNQWLPQTWEIST